MIKNTLALAAMTAALIAGTAEARDQIRIVGSSTVFPFSTAVAETFGKKTAFKTPIVESTGTGGGMKLFCSGIGENFPDITNASRRIKASEFKKCSANGIQITEVKIGFDGIVLANDKNSEQMKLTKAQLFLALAQKVPVNGKLIDNPYTKWSDIDPSLPNHKIEVLGPPPTSGTRDAFVEIAMEGGCKSVKEAKALGLDGKKCHVIREDGAFIDAGENDNLIVQKLEANPRAVGIFGFSFLDQNADRLQGTIVDGVEPTFEKIASGEYGVSRSLFFYVKQQHVSLVPGIREFVGEFTNENTWGNDGYLAEKGLIPLPAAARKALAISAQGLTQLNM